MHMTMEKQLNTTLRNSAPRHKDVHLLHHITSVVKSVHIFSTRDRVSKICFKAELCYHRYVHFVCVPMYVFGFHHKQCTGN